MRLRRAGDDLERVVHITPRLATDSLYALRRAALEGIGAGIASAWLVKPDLGSGSLVHLAPKWKAAALPVYLVYPASRLQPRRLRAFVDLVRQAMPDEHAA